MPVKFVFFALLFLSQSEAWSAGTCRSLLELDLTATEVQTRIQLGEPFGGPRGGWKNSEKIVSRNYDKYNERIFPSHREFTKFGVSYEDLEKPLSRREKPSVARFFGDFVKRVLKEESYGIVELIQAIKEDLSLVTKPVWADIGAGYAIPMREISNYFKGKVPFEQIAVDVVPWNERATEAHRLQPRMPRFLSGPFADGLGAIRQMGNYGTFTRHSPKYILERADRVTFETAPHLLTMVDSPYYFPDKLGTFTHLYNQLAPGGFLVATADSLSSSLAFSSKTKRDVLREYLAALVTSGATVAFSTETSKDNNGIYSIVVRKPLEGGTFESPLRFVSHEVNSNGQTISVYGDQ
ncbi:MAG: hypothetical protein ABL958_20540 [Bdellovibrionia bacterium]